jgi:hypothetical protein
MLNYWNGTRSSVRGLPSSAGPSDGIDTSVNLPAGYFTDMTLPPIKVFVLYVMRGEMQSSRRRLAVRDKLAR